MDRVRLRLAPGLEVQLADREMALRKVEEWAERGMVNVQLVFGPEGCGKTAWLRQSAVLLRELGFDVLYLNPLEREVICGARSARRKEAYRRDPERSHRRGLG